ncbi:ATP-binding cassette domain-containing protein, partial [Nocardia farcinica]|uniref:ATP-binding cassette domain-containing protein n=1 Tax=Nocardia farcinica TaxID=37329 RepID=UPI002455F607
MAKRIDVKDLNIYYGKFHAVADVSLTVLPRSVTAFIGPSGCGKSTVLRSLNRMHEVTPNARGGGRAGPPRREPQRAPEIEPAPGRAPPRGVGSPPPPPPPTLRQ